MASGAAVIGFRARPAVSIQGLDTATFSTDTSASPLPKSLLLEELRFARMDEEVNINKRYGRTNVYEGANSYEGDVSEDANSRQGDVSEDANSHQGDVYEDANSHQEDVYGDANSYNAPERASVYETAIENPFPPPEMSASEVSTSIIMRYTLGTPSIPRLPNSTTTRIDTGVLALWKLAAIQTPQGHGTAIKCVEFPLPSLF